jgi:2-polyprenyl-3-methyl-5-hydroxy-6-metoxy-1,4-benzoquinol methylase
MYEIWNRLQYVLSPQFDIYEQIAKIVKGRVLDVGSGTGFGTHLLARHANEVHGLEIDPRAHQFSDRVFSNGNLLFNQGDITKLKKSKRRFDFITMIDVIEHISQDWIAVEKCAAILKPDGVFYCSTPNTMSRYRKSENHFREYSPSSLRNVLKPYFRHVSICDYSLRVANTNYINPMIAECRYPIQDECKEA